MTQLLLVLILSLFQWSQSLKHNQIHQVPLSLNHQKLFATECIQATQQEFKDFIQKTKKIAINQKDIFGKINQQILADTLELFSSAKPMQSEKKCLQLFTQNLNQSGNLGSWYRYGNWCGENYGGFNSHCSEKCKENIWNPSEDCLKCRPPIDYVDTQCMYHDFCMERFQHFQVGNGSSCIGTLTLGADFLSPCSCPINLTYHLEQERVQQYCDTFDCRFNGNLIHNTFVNQEMTCTCTFKECQTRKQQSKLRQKHLKSNSHDQLDCQFSNGCTPVNQCMTLHGLFGEEDEGCQ